MIEIFQPRFYLEDKTVPLTTNVSYKTFDETGTLIFSRVNNQCFSDLTYGLINPRTEKVVITHPLTQIPYKPIIIQRWINTLNDLGFPCSVDITEKHALFTVKPKDFVKKHHFNSTLQLIRCLFETYICLTPDVFFKLTADTDTIENKFYNLQLAHIHLNSYKEGRMANSNHMITHASSTDVPISFEEFKSRLEKSKYTMKHSTSYSADECSLDTFWRHMRPVWKDDSENA